MAPSWVSKIHTLNWALNSQRRRHEYENTTLYQAQKAPLSSVRHQDSRRLISNNEAIERDITSKVYVTILLEPGFLVFQIQRH